VCSNCDVPQRRVLIADDKVRNRELLRIVFEHHGWEVSEAGDGVEAVSLAGATKPDLVLLDLELSCLDGYAAARQLRDAGQLGPKSLIALSETPEDIDLLRESGFSDCITKPVLLRVLSERIVSFLGAYAAVASGNVQVKQLP
jgi:two-component system, NarL family, capsular synthesis sensor histidine kinase RcsC